MRKQTTTRRKSRRSFTKKNQKSARRHFKKWGGGYDLTQDQQRKIIENFEKLIKHFRKKVLIKKKNDENKTVHIVATVNCRVIQEPLELELITEYPTKTNIKICPNLNIVENNVTTFKEKPEDNGDIHISSQTKNYDHTIKGLQYLAQIESIEEYTGQLIVDRIHKYTNKKTYCIDRSGNITRIPFLGGHFLLGCPTEEYLISCSGPEIYGYGKLIDGKNKSTSGNQQVCRQFLNDVETDE